MNELHEKALQWASQDPNPVTSQYVKDHADDTKMICKLFGGDRISFGTAGLRAAMQPGPCSMNDLVVIQAAQGIVRYCEKEFLDRKNKLRVVIGYDHREEQHWKLSSRMFAVYSALVFEHAGWDCLLLDGYVATPLVPFSMTLSSADVGIMITASHNPKQDAGYKVYWNNACQIRSPVDQSIAASILENLTPWTDYANMLKMKQHDDPCYGLSDPSKTKEMIDAYFQTLHDSCLNTKQANPVPKFCYTAMHGVGHRFAVRAFATFGFPLFESVISQQEPDASFPTVQFPNPEEKGALDLAQEFAQKNNCQIVLANDPDADRLAVAEFSDGKWKTFKGDEIGSLLGWWMWYNNKDQKIAMCASTVSSKFLLEMARVEGFKFEETLTGFKWIGSRAQELQEKEGYRSLFAYEEAIGYCCGGIVFDKDGISALLAMAELACYVYKQGKTLQNQLQSLHDTYGEFVSNNGYFFIKDTSVSLQIMKQMEKYGGSSWSDLKAVGPYAISSIRYLGVPAYDSTTTDRQPTLPTSKSSPMLTLRFDNGCVAQFRASGTEPKFKYYIEARGQPGVPKTVVEAELQDMSKVIIDELIQPHKLGLPF
ncbi:phosphoglucomutase / phosphopentomutase [Fistulifera solaris]|uniref:Phosphoglucomutase / phosphopentomutase n=1 Tax=Fistulifera solaris TaxID=1519565 RepID=A0A1Z5KEE2_FISSO|nr:phosphoglucomutase / phosphopentomutase [Fistulifera solaris]|eukprot:GAX24629.1 phosphoglucomutase / phosphopentomutase [Fistulifera solaris]